MASEDDAGEVAGTLRLLNTEEEVKLVPQPTDSPNDPLNWSPARKYWHASLVLFITGFTAATSNDAGSAGDAMVDELGISYGVQNTAAGVLFIGIGYWTLLASPMTTLYGRRIQYLICLIWSLIGSIWFARIKTKQDAIWCQLFVGASEGCAEALVQLSLSDLFYQHQRGTVLGLYVFATVSEKSRALTEAQTDVWPPAIVGRHLSWPVGCRLHSSERVAVDWVDGGYHHRRDTGCVLLRPGGDDL